MIHTYLGNKTKTPVQNFSAAAASAMLIEEPPSAAEATRLVQSRAARTGSLLESTLANALLAACLQPATSTNMRDVHNEWLYVGQEPGLERNKTQKTAKPKNHSSSTSTTKWPVTLSYFAGG